MSFPIKTTWLGDPITKKNSMRIYRSNHGFNVLPSKQFLDYQEKCIIQINKSIKLQCEEKVNVQCVYYLKTKRIVDLVNLLQATSDILVEGGVLKDDNSRIICSYDGSTVKLDQKNPRVEIEITKKQTNQQEEK